MTVPRLDAYWFHEREWADWDELAAAFEWEVPEAFNTADYVCDRWADGSGRLALLADAPDASPEPLTYDALRRRANRLASWLAARGVGRGDRVLIHGSQRPETLVSMVAAWKLGAVAVPVSTLLGADGLGFRLADTDAAAFVVDGDALATAREAVADLPAAPLTLVPADADPSADETRFDAALADGEPSFETAETAADDVGTVIYTSGTTGRPKGVLLPHRVLLGHLTTFVPLVCNMEIREDDLVHSPVEWTWVASVFVRLLPALYYGTATLAYDRGPFDPAAAFALIDEHDVTILGAAPTALRMMATVDSSPYDLSSVRAIGGGGEAFGEELRAWAHETFDGVVVHQGYGQTEANGLVGECAALADHRPDTVGRPLFGHDVRVVDPETLEVLSAGEVGEIAVRVAGDPVLSSGYLGRPDGMDEIRREGWHLTNDLGVFDDAGYLAFRGRKDGVIICSGYRIAPQELEAQLATHEAVAAVGVVGTPDETRGEIPHAFVVTVDGREGTPELAAELRAYARERLAKYEYPRRVTFVSALPRTTTDKVDRSKLAERAEREP